MACSCKGNAAKKSQPGKQVVKKVGTTSPNTAKSSVIKKKIIYRRPI